MRRTFGLQDPAVEKHCSKSHLLTNFLVVRKSLINVIFGWLGKQGFLWICFLCIYETNRWVKSCNDGGQFIDYCTRPALGDLIVDLCTNNSLESIRTKKVQKYAELVHWQQECSLLGFCNLKLRQNEIQNKTESVFWEAKYGPEKLN